MFGSLIYGRCAGVALVQALEMGQAHMVEQALLDADETGITQYTLKMAIVQVRRPSLFKVFCFVFVLFSVLSSYVCSLNAFFLVVFWSSCCIFCSGSCLGFSVKQGGFKPLAMG